MARKVRIAICAMRLRLHRALARAPLGTILSLVLALTSAGVILHRISAAGPAAPSLPDVTAEATAARSAHAPESTGAAPSPPSERRFGTIDEASAWLQMPLWRLSDLPAGLVVQEVLWIGPPLPPAGPSRASDRRGVVQVRYGTPSGPTEIVLQQGPAVAVSTDFVPDGLWGESTGGGGARLLWVQGNRPEEVEVCIAISDAPWSCPRVGAGSDVRVGTANGMAGWRLTSTTMPLERVLAIAARMVYSGPGVLEGNAAGPVR
jgi:hypothetical protein